MASNLWAFGKLQRNCPARRLECLGRYWFLDVNDSREKVEEWKLEYNEVRPHSAILLTGHLCLDPSASPIHRGATQGRSFSSEPVQLLRCADLCLATFRIRRVGYAFIRRHACHQSSRLEEQMHAVFKDDLWRVSNWLRQGFRWEFMAFLLPEASSELLSFTSQLAASQW